MLTLHIDARDGFNDQTNEFVHIKDTTLQLEHSLISLKKWEQKYHIPFLSPAQILHPCRKQPYVSL